MLSFKVTTVGISPAGIILRVKEAMARLGVEKGAPTATIHDRGAGWISYRLTPYDPEFERQMAHAE